MTPEQLKQRIRDKMADIERFKREDIAEIIGTEAVRHYNESFVNEGFTDKALKKWPDVKRRDPASPWYGFSYGANSQRPGARKSKGDKTNSGLSHFSPTRAKDKVLTGETMELKNSIHYIVKPDRVTIRSDKSYASVHQYGEPAKVFGKKSFTMKARPFIGRSAVLEAAIQEKIVRELKNTIK